MNDLKVRTLIFASGVSLGILVAPPTFADTPTINIVPSSPLIGSAICKPGYVPPQCIAIPFDTSNNLAFQGGSALPTVARDNLMGFAAIHRPEFANDGHYGNGASWISNSVNSWLKIDLGQTILINRLTFGRDQTGGYDDRDPGQFIIAVSTSDNTYVNGDDSNDENEYTQVVDSTAAGFSGIINRAETVQVSFAPVLARFVKLTVANYGTAIDEIEIFAAPKDEDCKHATYSLKKRTLTVPFIEMPVVDFLTGQPTGEVELWTGSLKQIFGTTNRFRLLSKTVAQITDGSSSSCPATYAVETGTLSIPYVDVPTGIAVGNNKFENGVDAFKATITWDPMGRSFVVQEVEQLP